MEKEVELELWSQHGNNNYVNFLDSDDILLPNHLEVASQTITELNSPEIIAQGFRLEDNYKNILHETSGKILRHLTINCIKILSDVMGFLLEMTSSKVIPLVKFGSFLGPEDWELWLRIASKYKIQYLHLSLISVLSTAEDQYII